MAYVAISRQLISDTMDNIRSMSNKELNALETIQQHAFAGVDDPVAVDLIWGPHAHLRTQVPEAWTQRFETVNVRINFVHEEQERHTTFSLKPAASGERFVVPRMESHGYSSAQYHIDEDHGFAKTVASAWIQRERQATDIRNKWDKVKDQVRQFLESTKSLNEGLKLWPALALYIDNQYIDRVNSGTKQAAKVSRAEEVLASIDTDSITAAAVSAKLTV